jgi:hypothetical protein
VPVSAAGDRENPVSASYGIATISDKKDIACGASAGILPSQHPQREKSIYFAQ